jgi:hypothetical protein
VLAVDSLGQRLHIKTRCHRQLPKIEAASNSIISQ